jgi:hypothetical protein
MLRRGASVAGGAASKDATGKYISVDAVDVVETLQ